MYYTPLNSSQRAQNWQGGAANPGCSRQSCRLARRSRTQSEPRASASGVLPEPLRLAALRGRQSCRRARFPAGFSSRRRHAAAPRTAPALRPATAPCHCAPPHVWPALPSVHPCSPSVARGQPYSRQRLAICAIPSDTNTRRCSNCPSDDWRGRAQSSFLKCFSNGTGESR